MSSLNIAVLGMGDMGAAVAHSLIMQGFSVGTTLEGRSTLSVEHAKQAGVQIYPTLEALLLTTDVLLSIVPPTEAVNVARAVIAGMPPQKTAFWYVDCNAIALKTTTMIAAEILASGFSYTDASLIGSPPGLAEPTRFYVSGPNASGLKMLQSEIFHVKPLGESIGKASLIKMFYSGLNKGFNALCASILTAASSVALDVALEEELSSSMPWMKDRIDDQMPYLPVNAARYVGEMKEIADTMAELKLPANFHLGAAAMYVLLAKTSYSKETRETFTGTRKPHDVALACALMLETQECCHEDSGS